MDMETKFFSWPLTGEDHVTVIARGRIDVDGVKQIFLNVAEITQMLVGCGVLIDMRQGRYRLTYRDVYGLFNELKPALWPLPSQNRLGVCAGDRAVGSTVLTQRLSLGAGFRSRRLLRYL